MDALYLYYVVTHGGLWFWKEKLSTGEVNNVHVWLKKMLCVAVALGWFLL